MESTVTVKVQSGTSRWEFDCMLTNKSELGGGGGDFFLIMILLFSNFYPPVDGLE